MNLNERCLLNFLQDPDELVLLTGTLEAILNELRNENE